ncbi:MAG TPA: methyl-accepting chemotaxis protein [Polyangiaceae bacterium]|jgi:methyl-accepting chemotaxis protein|nr:methyl-accepting chemotaxis protein [Polyangiaceae bacterium]
MVEKPKRRLFGLLRARKVDTSAAAPSPADAAALWKAHDRAASSVREVGEVAQRVASSLAKQRAAIEGVGDRARGASTRATDLATSFARVSAVFERLSLVALNASLEAARLGEESGQPLRLVAEEVRLSAARGAESARELSATLDEVGAEVGQLTSALDRAREAAADLTQETARITGAAVDVGVALGELGERIKRTTDTDPETARALLDAVEHGRAFVNALGALGEKVPRGILVGVLRPVIEPLGKWFGEDDGEEEP